MSTPITASLGEICRDRRSALDVSQLDAARALGISRSHYAAIESGRANPSLRLVDRIGQALGLELHLVASPAVTIVTTRIRDAVHARCSGYVARRLTSAGWVVLREVPFEDGRLRGWIDLLAYHQISRTLL